MRAGDTVHTPPGEEHWHGALPDHFMSHLAMWEDDDATWAAEGVAVQLRALSGGKPSTAQAHIYVFRHVPDGSADAFVRNSRRCRHAPVTSS